MSRSGYSMDYDRREIHLWRGQVASATRGKRGQKMFRELKDALEAMPVKQLVLGSLETQSGQVCALGALGKARGLDMRGLDPEEPKQVGNAFDIAGQLAAEVAFMNDEWPINTETAGERWARMHRWVSSQIKETK